MDYVEMEYVDIVSDSDAEDAAAPALLVPRSARSISQLSGKKTALTPRSHLESWQLKFPGHPLY